MIHTFSSSPSLLSRSLPQLYILFGLQHNRVIDLPDRVLPGFEDVSRNESAAPRLSGFRPARDASSAGSSSISSLCLLWTRLHFAQCPAGHALATRGAGPSGPNSLTFSPPLTHANETCCGRHSSVCHQGRAQSCLMQGQAIENASSRCSPHIVPSLLALVILTPDECQLSSPMGVPAHCLLEGGLSITSRCSRVMQRTGKGEVHLVELRGTVRRSHISSQALSIQNLPSF